MRRARRLHPLDREPGERPGREPRVAVHPVAKYLSAEERERACRAEYLGREFWGDTFAPNAPCPRACDGGCPLVVALDLKPLQGIAKPITTEICERRKITDSTERDDVYRAVCDFTHDFDRGAITPADLPTALGVLA
jgi:hypothetical protein